jgi:hypothetical protein
MRKTLFAVFLLTFALASVAPSQSTGSSKKTAARKTKGKSSVRRLPAVVRQATPSADRYKEIQQALAEKGYLKSEPNGVWDAESTAALAKFQTDRNLPPTGKLNSPSLIALGLGPGTAPVPPDPKAAASAAAPAASPN